MLNYSVYELVATSPLLHSASSDRHLFKPGAELLWAVVSSRWTAFETIPAAFVIVAGVAFVASLALSTLAWRATATAPSMWGARLYFSAVRRMPAYALVSGCTLLLASAIVWIWLDLVPLLGALCLPSFGERYTDLTQLALLGLVLAMTAGLFLLSDVVRGILAQRTIGVGTALVYAIGLMRSHPTTVLLQASIRFLAVVALQLVNVWLLARTNAFSGSQLQYISAILTTEIVALAAIRLRLNFMTWLVGFVRSHGE